MSVVVAVLLGIAALPSTVLAQAGVGIDPGEITGLPPIETDTPTTIAVTVRNPGTESADYQMLAQPLSGEAELPADPAWFGFEPTTFDLDGGDAQEVQVTFAVPEGTDAGAYLALVTAQLVLGEPETSGAQVGAAVATKAHALGSGVRPSGRRGRGQLPATLPGHPAGAVGKTDRSSQPSTRQGLQ